MSATQIYDQLFTDDMEYPVNMHDHEAHEIWRAWERRYLAQEMAYQIENDYPWVKKAVAKVESGETTWKEIFEEAWGIYFNEERSYARYFEQAMEEIAQGVR